MAEIKTAANYVAGVQVVERCANGSSPLDWSNLVVVLIK